jgi:uncharacterized protein YdaU (DUF1376 family)
VQWNVGDYTLGTQGMTLETEGAYRRFLMRLYAHGKPLPDDDSYMAIAMSLSRTIWRRVKKTLIGLGKIIVRAGSLTNTRFEKERIKRAEQMARQANAARVRWQKHREAQSWQESPKNPSQNSGKISEKISENPNIINASAAKNAYANHKLESNKNTILQRTREDLEALRKRLLEAGGSAINEAHPGFLVLADPIRWLDAGCDLEADIVPAIQRAIAAKRTGKITSWAYFAQAVTEERDRRLTPMEAPAPRMNGYRYAKPDWVVEREKQKAVIDSYDWS